MKIRSAAIAGLSLLATGVPLTVAFAQSTPPDLRDLVGARGSSGEQAMATRGYVNVGAQTGDDRVWTTWWNERRGACVTVATVNGRYDSITSTPAPDCRRNRPTTLPGPTGGPVGGHATTLPGPTGGPVASGRTETLRFDRGATSASRRGSITGYETVTYLVDVRAGQRMSVDLQTSNRSAYFNITAPGAREALFNGSITGARYTGVVPSSGTYRVEVYLMRNAARRGDSARYTITVGARR